MKKLIILLILLTANQLYCQNIKYDTVQVERIKRMFLSADSMFINDKNTKLNNTDKFIYDTISCKLLVSEDYNPFSRVVNGFIIYKVYQNNFKLFVRYLNCNRKTFPDDYIIWDYRTN